MASLGQHAAVWHNSRQLRHLAQHSADRHVSSREALLCAGFLLGHVGWLETGSMHHKGAASRMHHRPCRCCLRRTCRHSLDACMPVCHAGQRVGNWHVLLKRGIQKLHACCALQGGRPAQPLQAD